MIFTRSKNTSRYGDFFIRRNHPKGIVLDGSVSVDTESDMQDVIREMWGAFRDQNENVALKEKDALIQELQAQLEEAITLLASHEK